MARPPSKPIRRSVVSLSSTSATLDTGRAATASTITAFTPSANFGRATVARDPRQAQFGVKLTF